MRAQAVRRSPRLLTSFVLTGLVLLIYFAALIAVDANRGLFAQLGTTARVLPLLIASSLIAYLVRFERWRKLLLVGGHRVPFGWGFLGYVSGFALTISPGKLGELVRIRYFAPMGIPHDRIVACFILEHVLDLFVLLCLASTMAFSVPGIGGAAVFVWMVLAAVAIGARFRGIRMRLQSIARRAGQREAARSLRTLGRGFERLDQFMTVKTIAMAITFGVLAWSCQALGFVALVDGLAIKVPWPAAFAVFPAATVLGAASMLPGGIGSTEAATVLLLTKFGSALDDAVLAAIAVRLGTLWFSVCLGIGSIAILERAHLRPSR